jgi:hypothetical protein
MLHRVLLLTSIVVFVVSLGATFSLLARSTSRGHSEDLATYPSDLPAPAASASATPVIEPVIGHAPIPAPSPSAASPGTAAATPVVQQAPAPSSTTQTSPPRDAIKVDWPKSMELNRSDTLTVTLQKREDGSFSASASAPNRAAVEATLGPLVPPIISSPGVSAADLDVFALVRLDAPCFKPDSRDFDLQPISEMPLTWTFSIVAICDGTQRIGLTVYTVAISRRSNEQVGQRVPIWRKMLETEVSSPWITSDQASVMAILSGVTTAILGKIPFGKVASALRDRLPTRGPRGRPRWRQLA